MFRRVILAISVLLFGSKQLTAAEPHQSKIAAVGVTLLVTDDGLVFASGDADTERGDASELPRGHFLPIQGLKEIESVHLPFDYSDNAAALDRNGQVWLWGRNWSERLHGPDAKRELQCMPTHYPPLDGTQVLALGQKHLIAIKNGKVRTLAIDFYGYESGFLGAGDAEAHKEIVEVSGVDDAVQVAASGSNSLILRANGTVWGMGSGATGLLGPSARQGSVFEYDDAKNANLRPIPIQGLRNVTSISVGTRFAIALDRQGRVWGWGINDSGQLGPAVDDIARVSPRRIQGLKPCIAIAAGGDFMLALQKDGTVMAQGGNVYGALGDKRGELEGRMRQVQLPAAAKHIYGGQYNAFAELTDGRLLGWGANDPTVGGFHPHALFSSIPPTQFDASLKPKPASDVVNAGGAALLIYRDGDIEEPEHFEVLINDKSAGKLVVNTRQAVDEFKVEIPAGVQRYRIKGRDAEGTQVDNQGVIIVSQESMTKTFRRAVKEKGLVMAVEELKKQIDLAVPGFTPSSLDLKSDGPMSEDAVRKCESELGNRLPASYREVLKTIGPFRLGPSNLDLPLVALYKPDPAWTIGKWIDKAIRGSGQESDDSMVQEMLEEIGLYRPSFDRPAGQRLRQQPLLVGAVDGYQPYLLAPRLPACDDGSISQLWPDFFQVDIDSGEEWPSFGWTRERNCDLVMLENVSEAIEMCVFQAYANAGATFVIGNADGTLKRAGVYPLDSGNGFGISADSWTD